ncbi:dynein regulatory complex subunit 7-like isoform X2 [Corticium candelabrum]|uniref:dynein regulatory complex subunit 7-like isoform X2 n=1 Tax=Corticium candelabrum TaxID=121492 RepID=UPI002E25520B|nr:dynein regulatory complex subunit 7-like isoform X2 [Corticium candelabrum]
MNAAIGKKLVRTEKKSGRQMPESYRRNTKKEQLVLSYAENFRRQFVQLYRDRKPLYLAPKNDCGVEKLVCTSIRPTQLPYKELYDVDGCAQFLADYVDYLPLENPTELPQRLKSPYSVLHEQQGNCFEFSTLLCSLLIGNGYDAYCVSGYATREVCVMDESRDVCPLLEKKKEEIFSSEPKKKRKYTVKPPKDMRSKFIRKMEGRRVAEEAETAQRLIDEEDARQEELVQPEQDKFYGLRIHSWVLILHGKREVAESFFIEPSTGRFHTLQYDGYLGTESLWNDKNYWVNMQDCADGVKSMTYDLGNAAYWEYVFPSPTKPLLMLPEDQLEVDEFAEVNEEFDHMGVLLEIYPF